MRSKQNVKPKVHAARKVQRSWRVKDCAGRLSVWSPLRDWCWTTTAGYKASTRFSRSVLGGGRGNHGHRCGDRLRRSRRCGTDGERDRPSHCRLGVGSALAGLRPGCAPTVSWVSSPRPGPTHRQGQAESPRARRRACTHRPDRRHRFLRGLRLRGRSRDRGSGFEAGHLPGARPAHPATSHSRKQHVVDFAHQARRGHAASRTCHRNAFHESRPTHAARRDHSRVADERCHPRGDRPVGHALGKDLGDDSRTCRAFSSIGC